MKIIFKGGYEFEVNKDLKVALDIMDDKHFAGIDFDNPFVGNYL